jgi:hypothetical protein
VAAEVASSGIRLYEASRGGCCKDWPAAAHAHAPPAPFTWVVVDVDADRLVGLEALLVVPQLLEQHLAVHEEHVVQHAPRHGGVLWREEGPREPARQAGRQAGGGPARILFLCVCVRAWWWCVVGGACKRKGGSARHHVPPTTKKGPTLARHTLFAGLLGKKMHSLKMAWSQPPVSLMVSIILLRSCMVAAVGLCAEQEGGVHAGGSCARRQWALPAKFSRWGSVDEGGGEGSG